MNPCEWQYEYNFGAALWRIDPNTYMVFNHDMLYFKVFPTGDGVEAFMRSIVIPTPKNWEVL